MLTDNFGFGRKILEISGRIVILNASFGKLTGNLPFWAQGFVI
jgi:hypothetical protein